MVLSAAEIKAIASGNPQIVRKVQLETEVARLERVRAVWLDTRRSLRIERELVEEEIRRAESRRAQWDRAGAIVAAHPHELFCAEVAASLGSEQFLPMTGRAEAGASVRRLTHDCQSAAAFGRRRRRGVVARYRGLDLVVHAHPSFAAELSLALPDGTRLDAVSAETDSGLWQSVGHLISALPGMIARLEQRVAQGQERIATIDRELERLETWDSQAAYDAAVGELAAITAIFAAAEEQAGGEDSTAPAGTGAAPSTPAARQDDSSLADLLLTLAQEEGASDHWGRWQPIIPPAPASLAFMAAAAESVELPLSADASSMPGTPVLLPAAARPATVRRPATPLPASSEAFQQLSLFAD